MDVIRGRVLKLEQSDIGYVADKIYSELIPLVGKEFLNLNDFKRHLILSLLNKDFLFIITEYGDNIVEKIVQVVKEQYYYDILTLINESKDTYYSSFRK